MVKCNKCGKETNVVCLCGVCPKCNGIELFDEDFNKWLAEEKAKRTSNLVHQTSPVVEDAK